VRGGEREHCYNNRGEVDDDDGDDDDDVSSSTVMEVVAML